MTFHSFTYTSHGDRISIFPWFYFSFWFSVNIYINFIIFIFIYSNVSPVHYKARRMYLEGRTGSVAIF